MILMIWKEDASLVADTQRVRWLIVRMPHLISWWVILNTGLATAKGIPQMAIPQRTMPCRIWLMLPYFPWSYTRRRKKQRLCRPNRRLTCLESLHQGILTLATYPSMRTQLIVFLKKKSLKMRKKLRIENWLSINDTKNNLPIADFYSNSLPFFPFNLAAPIQQYSCSCLDPAGLYQYNP